MAKYRKKPVVIEAFKLPEPDNDNTKSFLEWASNVGFDNYYSEKNGTMTIITLEGDMSAEPADWIIKGVKGEFYPCKPDIFEATYEKVEEW